MKYIQPLKCIFDRRLHYDMESLFNNFLNCGQIWNLISYPCLNDSKYINIIVYYHHHDLSPELFIFHIRNSVPIKQELSTIPSLQSLTTTILLSVSINLTSYKWNCTLFTLLCLVYFTYHVLKVHPCCSICKNFLPFKAWIIFHSIYIHIVFIYLSVYGHLSCFQSPGCCE